MTREQAERKAMELYPETGTYADVALHLERASFMQCFDLMPTGSLPMTREEAELKAHQFANDEKIFNLPPVMLTHKVALRAALKMYDHLASLSSAAPAPVGVTRETDCPYPESMFPELSDAKLKVASFAIEAAGISSPQYTANIARFVWKQAVKTLTAPVSSAAQPATNPAAIEAAARQYAKAWVPDEQVMAEKCFVDGADFVLSSLNQKP